MLVLNRIKLFCSQFIYYLFSVYLPGKLFYLFNYYIYTVMNVTDLLVIVTREKKNRIIQYSKKNQYTDVAASSSPLIAAPTAYPLNLSDTI